MEDVVKAALDWLDKEAPPPSRRVIGSLRNAQAEPRPKPLVGTRDRHFFRGQKPGPDMLPGVTGSVLCTFCDKRFKTPHDAAQHEASRHRKRLRKLMQEVNNGSSI